MEIVTVELDRNSSGEPFIGITYERDETPYRTCVLAHGGKHTADVVMRRRFDDLCELLKDDVRTVISKAFTDTYNPNPI